MIGQCLKPQGIKGEVKVKPMTDDLERFIGLENVDIQLPDGSYKNIGIDSVRIDAKFAYILFDDVNDRSGAEKYRNTVLWIDKTDAVKLPDGRFFIGDVIDCAVVTKDGRKLGKVYDIFQTGSNDVYVVKGKQRDILLPALKILMEINIAEKLIIVDQNAMDGLIEDED